MTVRRLRAPVLLLVTLLLLGCFAATGSDREQWQPPEQIMDSIGVTAGMVIGEVGAGKGYLSFPLAKRVGPTGKVYANEISASDLEIMQQRAGREGVDNIETVLGEVDDPRFPERQLDMIIMVYVLHHLDQPAELLQSLRGYLRPDALLVIIERNTSKERDQHDHHSFLSGHQVLRMLQEAGYELIRTETFLPKDTIYLFNDGSYLDNDGSRCQDPSQD